VSKNSRRGADRIGKDFVVGICEGRPKDLKRCLRQDTFTLVTAALEEMATKLKLIVVRR